MTQHREELNKLVANLTVLYTKLHSFHWYVSGRNFYTLHEVFEKYYKYTSDTLDDAAERLLSIDGRPVSTLKGALEIATIKEATEKETPGEMVTEVLSDFKLLAGELTILMGESQKVGDEGTFDFALGVKTHLEKNIWMLNAYHAE